MLKNYTAKSYDDERCCEQLKQTSLAACVTVAMHAWKGFTSPMLLACTQPFFLASEPMFQQRILRQNVDVQRPAKDKMKQCEHVLCMCTSASAGFCQ